MNRFLETLAREHLEIGWEIYIVIYNSQKFANSWELLARLYDHSQEEEGKLMIIYPVKTSKIDPFKELYVMSSDTNVLVSLIYYCCLLCNKTVLITERKDSTCCINIYDAYEVSWTREI